MASSDTQICNLALMRLGLKPISALTENNDRALACSTIFTDIRDQVLSDGEWSFAVARAELTLDAATPLFGFANQFLLPADCLRVLETDDDFVPWKVENGRLLTDRSSVKVRYVRRIVDVTQYSAPFVDALAEKLAAELALPLAGDLRAKDFHTKLYHLKLQTARSRDSQQGSPDVLDDLNDLVLVR